MLTIVVTGSRDADDRGHIRRTLLYVAAGHGPFVAVWHGGARGADELADEVARSIGWGTRVFHADWNQYHRAAGPLRNERMVHEASTQEGRVICVAYPSPSSRGTLDCIDRAWRAGIPTFIFPLLRKGSEEDT